MHVECRLHNTFPNLFRCTWELFELSHSLPPYLGVLRVFVVSTNQSRTHILVGSARHDGRAAILVQALSVAASLAA